MGCNNATANAECSSTSVLTDDDFTYSSTDYSVIYLFIRSDSLAINLSESIPDNFKAALTLNVGNRQFAFADASVTSTSARWSNSGLSWSVGDTVSLSLTEPSTTTPTRPNPPAAQPTEYWSTTLSVNAVDYGLGCGYRTGQPNCSSALNLNWITYHEGIHQVMLVHVAYGDTLQLILDSDPVDTDGTRTERARMALNVGSKQFLVKDAMISYGIAENNAWTNEDAWVLTWTNSGLSWSEGDSVPLSLVTLPVGGL